MFEGGVRTDQIRFVPVDVAPAISRYRIYRGELFITVAGTLGVVGEIPPQLDGANLTENADKLTNIKIDLPFLKAYLQSPFIKKIIDAEQTQNAQPKLAIERINAFPIPIPPRHEQPRIAEIISTWDAAIEKTERLIAAKQQRQEILTNKLYNLSDREGVATRFDALLTESSVSGASGLHAKKLSIKLYGKGVVAKDEKRVGSAQTQYFVRRAGQLVYSKLDFLNGAFGIVPVVLDGYESTLDLPAFDIAPSVDPIWLLGYLTRPAYYTRQVGLARGQRKARRIHPSDLLASALHVPPLDLQRHIGKALNAMQVDIEISTRLLTALKTQKRGLMQKLLTGQWRLKPDMTKEIQP